MSFTWGPKVLGLALSYGFNFKEYYIYIHLNQKNLVVLSF